jgi:UDPglucose 6-dehydrogenase
MDSISDAKTLPGAPTAAVIALQNPSLRVTVVDRDERRIRRWNSAHLPIREPGLDTVVRVARDGLKASATLQVEKRPQSEDYRFSQPRPANLFFTTACGKCISEADIVFIAVNTPTKISGVGAGHATDMTAFECVVEDVATHAKPDAILVEKSTVPCRTANLVQDILDEVRPGSRNQILSNPEFLSEGTAIKDLMKPDRILIGSANTVEGRRAAAALVNVYASWVPRSRILGTNVFSSELSKLVANAMLAQRISSINSIGAICEKTGADVHEIAKSIGLDRRIGPQFLKAGLGFGGSCFRKDIGSLVYLAKTLGLDEVADYWNAVQIINQSQRTRFARKVISRLNGTLRGKKITMLGFAFKKDTGDTRESVAIDIIRILLEERPAEVAIFDPGCSPEEIHREIDQMAATLEPDVARLKSRITVSTEPYQACLDSNAICIVTDWDHFKTAPSTFTSKSPKDILTKKTVPVVVASPLDEIRPEQHADLPSCPKDCPECTQPFAGFAIEQDFEWARILYHMKGTKWIFDGRGVLDVPEMERLGARVEVLGTASDQALLSR